MIGLHQEYIVKIIDFEDARFLDDKDCVLLDSGSVVNRQNYSWIDPNVLQSHEKFNGKLADGTKISSINL